MDWIGKTIVSLSYCEHFLDLIEGDKIFKDTEDVWGRFPSSVGGESVPGQSPKCCLLLEGCSEVITWILRLIQ